MEKTKESKLKSGYLKAAKVTKRYASTFFYSSLFLSPQARNAAYSIYCICRLSDEATDKDASLIELSTAKRNIELVYNGKDTNMAVLMAFKETVEKYSIPRYYFDELIEGMYMDFRKNRYNDFAELKEYCYRVAGVVGLMMLKVFGCNDYEAQKYAVNLGIAMQLTNILRDIKEDYRRGRIYLPQEEMLSCGVSEDDIKNCLVTPGFKLLLKSQIKRARQFYLDSEPGLKMIADKRSRFVAAIMKEVYSGILDEIEKNNYDVFSKRAFVGFGSKLIRTLKVMARTVI